MLKLCAFYDSQLLSKIPGAQENLSQLATLVSREKCRAGSPTLRGVGTVSIVARNSEAALLLAF